MDKKKEELDYESSSEYNSSEEEIKIKKKEVIKKEEKPKIENVTVKIINKNLLLLRR